MNKVNYQKLLDEKIEEFVKEGRVPALFLHACCAPCSSYTLEYLSKYFNITIYFYNPNIDTKEEYEMRIQELNRLIKEMPLKNEVKLISGTYEPEKFYEIVNKWQESQISKECEWIIKQGSRNVGKEK